jgi:hypothetical protein
MSRRAMRPPRALMMVYTAAIYTVSNNPRPACRVTRNTRDGIQPLHMLCLCFGSSGPIRPWARDAPASSAASPPAAPPDGPAGAAQPGPGGPSESCSRWRNWLRSVPRLRPTVRPGGPDDPKARTRPAGPDWRRACTVMLNSGPGDGPRLAHTQSASSSSPRRTQYPALTPLPRAGPVARERSGDSDRGTLHRRPGRLRRLPRPLRWLRAQCPRSRHTREERSRHWPTVRSHPGS